MTLSKCYTEIFDTTMKEAGFQRKGVLYYRLNGDILQGIVLKPLAAYDICFTYFPYWNYHFRSVRYALKSGYWAELGQFISGEYCRKGQAEATQETMQKCLGVIKTTVIPLLDNISDVESYLNAVVQTYVDFQNRLESTCRKEMDVSISGFTGEILGTQSILQHALLYKAYLDGSYTQTNAIVQRLLDINAECIRIRHRKDKLQRGDGAEEIQNHVEMLMEMCPDMPKEEAYRQAVQIWAPKDDSFIENEIEKSRAGMLEHQLPEYIKRMESNDLVWIESVYDEECEKMKEEMLTELKLVVK